MESLQFAKTTFVTKAFRNFVTGTVAIHILRQTSREVEGSREEGSLD